MIRLSQPHVGERSVQLVSEVIRSGQLASGPYVSELETRVAALTGVAHAVAVSSGTAALEMAFEATLRPGDTVLTTPFTFAATLNSALRAGAVVRFADVDEEGNLDPESVWAELDSSVTAIVPVHLYGRPCAMIELARAADEVGAIIVEDAAQALGARDSSGRAVGSWQIGCFSLYATKNVSAGEGGVLTTDDDRLAGWFRRFANQGSSTRYEYEMVGTNRRLTDIQAALALPQFDEITALTERRRDNAERLRAGLTGLTGLRLPSDHPGHVYHQFTVRVTADARLSRDSLRQHLRDAGIESGVHYPRLVYDYPCYLTHPGVKPGDHPVASRLTREVLSLPVHPGLTTAEIEKVIDTVRSVLRA